MRFEASATKVVDSTGIDVDLARIYGFLFALTSHVLDGVHKYARRYVIVSMRVGMVPICSRRATGL